MTKGSEAFLCRGCYDDGPSLVVDLGRVPASDLYPDEADPGPDERWPLRLFICPACGLVQLGPEPGPGPETPTHVVSATARSHASTSVADIMAAQELSPGTRFVELDSGHGGDWRADWTGHGLVPAEPGERAGLVADVHHLMHAEDLGAVLDSLAGRVGPGGLLVAEFFHVLPMVTGTLIDTVRHGHFVYLSVHTAARLLEARGFVVTSAVQVPSYGGSVRVTARRADERPEVDDSVAAVLERERTAGATTKEGLAEFGRRSVGRAAELRAKLATWRSEGRRVAAYGAPSKAPVLAALAGIDADLVPYTADLSTAKHGHRIAGTRIPIRSVDCLVADRPDVVLLFGWDIAEEIRLTLADRGAGSGWDPVLHAPLPEGRDLRLAW